MAGISPTFTRGGPSAFGIYKCNGSSNKNWSGVVLLQASLLHWLGGPSAYGMYMCISLYISIDVPLHWYFLIYSYKFTVSNGLSLTTLNSKEFTLQSGSLDGGVHLPMVSTCVLVSIYISIDVPLQWYFLVYSYKLTVSNGLSLMTLNSKEFTLPLAVLMGGRTASRWPLSLPPWMGHFWASYSLVLW